MGRLKDIGARLRELGRELGAGVAGGVEDSGHSALYLRQLLRGNRERRAWRPRGEVPATPPGQPPVLLIHGYLATRGSLHLLERQLTERGLVVMTYSLGPVHLGDIRDSAGLIARKVESIVAQTEVTHVDIVGHSMGGLVGLDYLKRLGGRHRVRRLIMLGTPTHGTWSALLGLVSLQLLPGSPFLRELADRPLPAGAEVISIGAIRDWLAPLSSTVLDGIRHIALPTGHSGLLVDDEVAKVVADLLLDGPPPGSVDAAHGSP